MLKRFLDYIYTERLFSKGDRLLLAVSGGLDSTALVKLVHEAGYAFVIAHCNFGLRGEESDRDEAFVRRLGRQYGAEVAVRCFDTKAYAAREQLSIQAAARQLRYAWFEELLQEWQASGRPLTFILTAHHADDNIETLLMNFFKGTGISGLRGILPRQGRIVRPLLCFTREEIKSYAEAQGLEWVEDSSNESDHYTRNYFRHHVIPLIEKQYPAAMHNLQGNLQRFRDIEALYRRQVEQEKKQLLEQRGGEVHIPVLKLQKSTAPRTILYEVISNYGFSAAQTDEAMALLNSETGKYAASATHRLIRNRSWLIIAPLYAEDASVYVLKEEGTVGLPGGMLLKAECLTQVEGPVPAAPEIALLDAKHIQFPLVIRRWKSGDYFYPLGMPKKKKVGRFLSDLKRSVTRKEAVWVVEMNRKIIWVMGERIDDRFKITPATTAVIRLSYRKNGG